MSTLKPFRVDYYIGFGKPRQTTVVQATSVSVAGDIFKAMMPTTKISGPPGYDAKRALTINSAQRSKSKKFLQ
jgi:hypothetical protein